MLIGERRHRQSMDTTNVVHYIEFVLHPPAISYIRNRKMIRGVCLGKCRKLIEIFSHGGFPN